MPKLVRNGIAYVDDYEPVHYPGVVQAVDEWLLEHPEFGVLQQSYCMLIKRLL
jgi:hypothetical protein